MGIPSRRIKALSFDRFSKATTSTGCGARQHQFAHELEKPRGRHAFHGEVEVPPRRRRSALEPKSQTVTAP